MSTDGEMFKEEGIDITGKQRKKQIDDRYKTCKWIESSVHTNKIDRAMSMCRTGC